MLETSLAVLNVPGGPCGDQRTIARLPGFGAAPCDVVVFGADAPCEVVGFGAPGPRCAIAGAAVSNMDDARTRIVFIDSSDRKPHTARIENVSC